MMRPSLSDWVLFLGVFLCPRFCISALSLQGWERKQAVSDGKEAVRQSPQLSQPAPGTSGTRVSFGICLQVEERSLCVHGPWEEEKVGQGVN